MIFPAYQYTVFFEVDGRKTPPLLYSIESSLAGPCSYNQIEEIKEDTRKRKTTKNTEKSELETRNTNRKGKVNIWSQPKPLGG